MCTSTATSRRCDHDPPVSHVRRVPQNRTRRLVLAGLLAGLLIGAACSNGADDSTGTAADSPDQATSTEAPPTTALSGPPVGAVAQGLRSITPGVCFWPPEDDPGAEDTAVWVVDCAVPHRHEILDVIRYDGPVAREGRFPGSSVIEDWANEQCYARFEPFVGSPWTRSELDLYSWWPSAASWDRADRSVICVVFDPSDEVVTSSFRDTQR